MSCQLTCFIRINQWFKAMTVEWENLVEGEAALSTFMEESGFIRIGTFDVQWSKDVIFIQDLINNVWKSCIFRTLFSVNNKKNFWKAIKFAPPAVWCTITRIAKQTQ